MVAPNLFLNPTDWWLEHFVHRGMVGTSLSTESFTDFDCADDVAVLVEILSVLVLCSRDHG